LNCNEVNDILNRMNMNGKKPRYFERPDDDEKPMGFLQVLVIVMSSHLGVRPRAKREEDFRRANGLHIFVAGIVYFLLILTVLILFVRSIG